MAEKLSLLCCETDIGDRLGRAIADPVLLNDHRVLDNLLATEDKYLPHTCYFNCVQTDIQPYMRKMVTEWMAEVCAESRMEEEVFPLSVNYLDRFLSVKVIHRTQLQLLGAACMFLASKLKETSPISGQQLVIYTDSSVTLEDLTEMESKILQLLKWDLSAVVANDFLDHILHRLSALHKLQVASIKRHAQAVAVLCATDCKFMQTPPSMIACAAIGRAMRTIYGISCENLHNLNVITGIDMDLIRSCMEQIEQTVMNCMVACSKPDSSKHETTQQELPTTPTDVREVNICSSTQQQQQHTVY